MIVLSSTHAAASPWVEKEIDSSARPRPSRSHLAIVADTVQLDANGADATPISTRLNARGNALPIRMLPNHFVVTGTLARARDGFGDAYLKVVAGLIGVTPGQLIDGDRRRRRVRQRLCHRRGHHRLDFSWPLLPSSKWTRKPGGRFLYMRKASRKKDGCLDAEPFAVAGIPAFVALIC